MFDPVESGRSESSRSAAISRPPSRFSASLDESFDEMTDVVPANRAVTPDEDPRPGVPIERRRGRPEAELRDRLRDLERQWEKSRGGGAAGAPEPNEAEHLA